MKKLNLVNLVLFIIVIALAFVIYFSEEQDTQLQRLTDIDANSISSINIQHNKNSTVIVKQNQQQWQITQPVVIAANNFRISSILKLINAPIHNQYASSEINLKDIGLEKPATVIQFDNYRIFFGTTNPATKLRYIQLNETVYTIEDIYFPLISSHFGTLVSFNLLPADSNIEKLILVNQTVAKDDRGLWQSNINISADNINKTIDHWKHLQAFGVHEYMPRKQLGEVFIYSKDQQPIRYIITDTDPWLILANPETGLEYHLDIEAYDKLIAPR